jgi:molybdopterin converting factor small subunit
MVVRVEFFGIVRHRAGIACCDVETRGTPVRLSDVLLCLEHQYPALAGSCLERGRLCAGYIANLDGQQFVTDPTTPLLAGQSVLIMSADLGG